SAPRIASTSKPSSLKLAMLTSTSLEPPSSSSKDAATTAAETSSRRWISCSRSQARPPGSNEFGVGVISPSESSLDQRNGLDPDDVTDADRSGQQPRQPLSAIEVLGATPTGFEILAPSLPTLND